LNGSQNLKIHQLFTLVNKGQVFFLDKYEQEIVELSANQRHNNKIETGWNGLKTVNKSSDINLNIVGFGAEFIFCREFNLFPDFKIHNMSKQLKTDTYDCILNNKTIDIKVNRNSNNPFMVPQYAKSDCDLFFLFSSKFPKYRFEGYATNEMIFKKENLKMTRVMAYVLDKIKLLDNYVI